MEDTNFILCVVDVWFLRERDAEESERERERERQRKRREKKEEEEEVPLDSRAFSTLFFRSER